jgi:hypothetical protein
MAVMGYGGMPATPGMQWELGKALGSSLVRQKPKYL